jgi:hypothetical protein
MDMQQAFRARLVAAGPVSALVQQRIYWGIRPPKTPLPAITLNVITGNIDEHMKGVQPLQFARVQIDCWGTSYSQTKDLVDAMLAAALPRSRGNGIYFRRASATTPRDMSEEADTATIHRKQTDLIVRFSPA